MLLDAHRVDLDKAREAYPPGSERVEIAVEPGVTLRGLYVPSQPNAPVVLHLLESSGSAGSTSFHFGPVTRELADLGYASLLVDYAGVGSSDGDRSVRHLERDASAMWDEAVRRAGGDEARVHVRATSLGTIACALLLQRGIRPASMVWIAPVLPESVTSRFAHVFYGPLQGWFAGVFFRDVADVDVPAVLLKAQIPGIVLSSNTDPLVTERERDILDNALQPAARLHSRSGGHIQLSMEAHNLLREELQVFVPCTSPDSARARTDAVLAALPAGEAERFAAGSEARARLERLCELHRGEPASTVAAAALSISRPAIAARMLWMLARRPYVDLEFVDTCAVLSLEDPSGDLPIDLIERASNPSDLVEQFGGMRVIMRSKNIAYAARGGGLNASAADWGTLISIDGVPSIEFGVDGHALFQALLDRGLSTADAERQFIRILLKSQRIPDRLVTNGDGEPVVEVRVGDAWQPLDRNPEERESNLFEFRKLPNFK